MRPKIFLVLAVLLLPFIAKAGEYSFSLQDSKLKFSGVVDFSMGEIMKGKYRAMAGAAPDQDTLIKRDVPVSHVWFGNPLARLNFDFSPGEKIRVLLGFEGAIFLNEFPLELGTNATANGGPPTFPQYVDWRLHQAQGIVSILKEGAASLDLSIGLMPYKYNPEVRNLGEFLFRSGTYPFVLFNNYNFPLARLSGLRLNFKYGTEKFGLTVDQFVLMERETPPLNDISLATIVGANLMKIVDIGVGVDFARLIPVNGILTTPERSMYLTSTGDTGHYTFKGTKVMTRLSIDPIGMVRGDKGSMISQIFGENGGKIYGEIAIIGLRNYPVSFEQIPDDPRYPPDYDSSCLQNLWGYTKISERMPWVVGINIPAWKLLDVCAFELEKYPAPYPNDGYQAFYNKGLPIPTFIRYLRTTPGYDSASYGGDRWYWSLHMKKHVMNQISIIGQLSRDHERWSINLGRNNNYDPEEIMPKKGQWAWRLGLSFEF